MRPRTRLAIGAGAAVAAVGAGAAVGASQLLPATEDKAVVEDAAKQLGVEPAKLREALKQALENRIDEAVEAGRLTEEQGTAMKQRLESDELPLFGGPPLGLPHMGHHRGFANLEVAADYLGLTQADLRDALEGGATLAQVAKDENRSVDGLVGALVAATTKKLDEAVADGLLTKAQRDRIASSLKERTADAVNGVRPAFRELRPGRFFGFRGPGHHGEEPPPPAA
jgi:uncharacterized protein (DUF433 family)